MLEAKSIMFQRPEVVAEHLFIEIPEQVKRLDANVGALQSALEQTPEVFESVSVNLSVNVALRMVDNFVPEIFLEPHVGHERVRVDRAACLHVSVDVGLQRVFFAIRNDHSADFAATFQNAEDRSLVFSASLSNPATMFLAVHVSRSPADESFIYFNFATVAADFENRAVLHCKPNTVKHEPRRLLGDAKSAANFIRTDSVLAIRNHPNSDKPLVERERRILKDSPDLGRELPLGMDTLALPLALILEEYNVITSAGGADHDAIRPADFHHKVEAVVGVRKVDDGLLEGFRFFHVSHLKKNTLAHLICQVYYCLCKC